MNARITSIENLITKDPGGRNIFELMLTDQLRLAAQSLRLAKRVGIVSGFYIPEAGAGETDGPPGAKALGDALVQLGVAVDYITDRYNAPLFVALGLDPLVEPTDYLVTASPTHLVSIERLGRAIDSRYHNMRGDDVTETTPPLDGLFLEARRRGLTTIGIGDGGNEIGMGRVFARTCETVWRGKQIASLVGTDFCIASGVSNWGGYGLAGALSVIVDRDLLPTPEEAAAAVEAVVRDGGAVDGVTLRNEPTVDGIPLPLSIRMLENIRRQIAPSPLTEGVSRLVGILGYGETGRAAARLLTEHRHRVRISDCGSVALDEGVMLDGVETGGHSIEFLKDCDLVVASPGVRADSPIRDELHRHGIPVMSELEMAYQFCDRDIIGVTGTVGKRTTVELMQRLFDGAGAELSIGGNRGKPLSALLVGDERSGPIAVAVSSFQLETIVHFRPHLAVILNLKEAHLDRHESVAEYVRIKSRIFMNQGYAPEATPVSGRIQGALDTLVLPFDDARLRALSRKHHGRTLFVSPSMAVDRGAWFEGESVMLNIDGQVDRIALPRGYRDCPWLCHAENLLGSLVVARARCLDVAALTETLDGLTKEATRA